MIKAFFANPRWRWHAYGGGALVIGSLIIQTYLEVLFNDWQGQFGDRIGEGGKGNIDEFWELVRRFNYIVFAFIIVIGPTKWLGRVYALWWREAITEDYLPRWRNVKFDVEGASQRIQEDTARFAKIIHDLGGKALGSVMTLIAFIPILWGLSADVQVPYFTWLPHALFWLSIGSSFGGMVISWFVGIKLPGLEYNNQKVEARFRKELVRGEDDKENFASLRTLSALWIDIRTNYRTLYNHYAYFDFWTSGYGQYMIILPFMAAGPSLVIGLITLGTFTKITENFVRVNTACSFLIDNWTEVTELRSIFKRLSEFERNLDCHDYTNVACPPTR